MHIQEGPLIVKDTIEMENFICLNAACWVDLALDYSIRSIYKVWQE